MVLKKNSKAALELSIGTIVILVLAMSMLILGLILVRNIFSGATGAINSINKGVEDEINKLFADSDAKIAIYPSSRKIEIKQRTQGEGFAFSVRNTDLEESEFTYKINVDENFDIETKCKINFGEANDWLDVDSGSFTLGGSTKLELPELVTFTIPENAPACTIPYQINIRTSQEQYASGSVRLTIKAR